MTCFSFGCAAGDLLMAGPARPPPLTLTGQPNRNGWLELATLCLGSRRSTGAATMQTQCAPGLATSKRGRC